jgi:DNA-binding response OmpR family regulator
MEDAAAGPTPAILIAEDELLLALEIEDMVRNIGCTVVGPVAGVAELLILLETTHCDAALLDVHLRHGEPVYAVIARLRVLGIPFVFLTAYGEADIDPGYADVGMLCKPFNTAEVEHCVGALLASKHQAVEDRSPA